jgi:peptidoglycan-N-acetylglucosamine deacetylase
MAGTSRQAVGTSVRRLLRGKYRLPSDTAVALTFDDGPHPEWTPRLLDVLAGLDLHATFFLIGRNAEAHPDVVERTVAEGHRIGSHSYAHQKPGGRSLRALRDDYRAGQAAVEQVAGVPVRLWRPPWANIRYAASAFACAWYWTRNTEDYERDVSAGGIAAAARELEAGDVVLMHDGGQDRSATIAAVPSVVSETRRGGLRFALLPHG